MIVLPAVQQWANAYTFSTTVNAEEGAGYQSFVIMVCAGDQVSGLLFDGKVWMGRVEESVARISIIILLLKVKYMYFNIGDSDRLNMFVTIGH